ncbi:MAG TPA: flagellin [Candidatus Aquilonibacter sp.]|nr:flagellin [Candidatus Aquilonibacter sp.]
MLSILNNIPSLVAQNDLQVTAGNLQNTLEQLASGQRINSGADDAAGLAIADGLQANETALNQSAMNANDGIGALQVADGALSQVTTLLNRAVTLATESSTGTVSDSQRTAIQAEFAQIQAEITSIGQSTEFNGTSVFTANPTSIFLSDGNSAANTTISVSVGTLSATGIGLTASIDLSSAADAQTALGLITTAISTVAGDRGTIGANVNRLQASVNVENVEVQNLTAAEDSIMSVDVATAVSNLSKYSMLQQTGIAAVGQANSSQQGLLQLLQG